MVQELTIQLRRDPYNFDATEVKATFDPTISELPASVQKYRWSIDEIERRLQHKIEQRTSKRSDQFRQAFRMFDKNVSAVSSGGEGAITLSIVCSASISPPPTLSLHILTLIYNSSPP